MSRNPAAGESKDSETFKARKRKVLQHVAGMIMAQLIPHSKRYTFRCALSSIRFAPMQSSCDDCAQHRVTLADGNVHQCNFTLGLYIVDTLEKWDLLNPRHKSIVQDMVAKEHCSSAQYDRLPRRAGSRGEYKP